MRILYNNELENATISATNEDSSYPVENITHRFLEKIFKPTGPSVVTIEFNMDTALSCIAVGFQNAATGTYTLKDSVGSTVLTGSLALTYETDMTYFTETTCRSLELSFTGTDYYIGGVSAGVPIEIDYWNVNPRQDKPNLDSITRLRGGQTTGYRSASYLRYRATVGDLPEATKREMFDMIDVVGNWKPHYFDMYEDAHEYGRPIHCIFLGDNQYVRDSLAMDWSTTLVYEETR